MEQDEAADRAAKIKRADAAAKRVEENVGDTEKQWPIIVEGFAALRKEAMRIAITNDINSGRYRQEFGRLRGLHKHLANFSPSEASACCWAHENPGEYEMAKATLSKFYGQAPTPYTVYQKAMRIKRAKDATTTKNAKETREALQAKADEADQEIARIAEDRDRVTMLGHEKALLLQRRIDELEAEREKPQAVVEAEQVKAIKAEARAFEAELRAEMELLRRENRELKAELETARRQIEELRAGKPRKPEREAAARAQRLGVTQASVVADLREVLAEHGDNLSATAKALGYRSHTSLRALLAKGEKMTLDQALKVQERIDGAAGGIGRKDGRG